MRFIASLVLVALVAGCGGTVPDEPNVVPSRPTIENAVVIAPATADTWQQVNTLQSPVDAYAAAWTEALGATGGFEATVGVAALAQGDAPASFCGGSVDFDPNGAIVRYCSAVKTGPDPAPQAGFILVPYQPYMSALNSVVLDRGRLSGQLGTALLMARAYAQHLAAEFELRSLIAPLARHRLRQQIDCLAGLNLRAYVPAPLDEQLLSDAIGFAEGLRVFGAHKTTMRQALVLGFTSGRLASCLA